MARILPILLAVICSAFSQCFASFTGQHMTGRPPLYSTYAIRFALYFLLLKSTLYLRTLRKLHPILESILQFILGLFIIESSIVYIWYPLQNAILCIIPLISRLLYGYVPRTGILHNLLWYNTHVMNNNVVLIATSYLLSSLILFSIMHATRAVDFRLILAFGLRIFIEDAWRKFTRGLFKVLPAGKRAKPCSRYNSECYSSRNRRNPRDRIVWSETGA